MKAAFDNLNTGVKGFEVNSLRGVRGAGSAEADVVVVSGFWKNHLLPESATRLKFIQSISAGINQYDLDILKAGGVRLASAQGVNMNAVSDHAMSLDTRPCRDGCRTRGTIRLGNSWRPDARANSRLAAKTPNWPGKDASHLLECSGGSAAVWRSWPKPST